MKIEGTFILRYRVFDIFSKAEGMSSHPIQAEWYGEPFKVYSTKEFPGLKPSTELTKVRQPLGSPSSPCNTQAHAWYPDIQLINRYGVRLNIREAERKRRKTNTGQGLPLGGEGNPHENDSTQAEE